MSLGSRPAPGVWFQTGWRRGCGCQMSVIPSSLPFQPPLPPMLMALETQLSESPRGQPVSHCEPQAASCLRLLRILSQAACSVQAQCRCKCGSCHSLTGCGFPYNFQGLLNNLQGSSSKCPHSFSSSIFPQFCEIAHAFLSCLPERDQQNDKAHRHANAGRVDSIRSCP